MAWDLGWKKKAERLRMVILSGGHQRARELPPGLSKALALFRRAVETGDGSILQEGHAHLKPDEPRPLWEPIEIHGWKIATTMYLLNGQLWWLVYAHRQNEKEPSTHDLVFLNKVLEHLGANPTRDMIIGPGSLSLPFGWWTWLNESQLYEIQANSKAAIRIVPFGSAESDGYKRVDLAEPS